ncbi:MAG: rhomboid family intramembrane serine protease [Bacteroidia bacterium]
MLNLVTITIIISCVIFSLMAFKDRAIFEKYMFSAYAIRHYRQRYRFLSHAFIHADYAHLILNMFVLYMIGSNVEKGYHLLFGKMATLYYILLYTGSIYGASIFEYFKHRDNPAYSSVGASGAVNAVLFSFILLFPNNDIHILFIPFGIPGWIFGILFLAYSFYMNKRNTDNIGHGAHAWGAIFGFVFTAVIGYKEGLISGFIDNIFHLNGN